MKEEEAVEDTEYLTLVDSRNVFNEISCLVILYTVRHRWLSNAKFTLNCYRHEALLIVCRLAALCHIIMSREEVTQKDPLSMVIYILAILNLAKSMREADLRVLQLWYLYDAAMRGMLRQNDKLLCALMLKFPYHGYFMDLYKSCHICT